MFGLVATKTFPLIFSFRDTAPPLASCISHTPWQTFSQEFYQGTKRICQTSTNSFFLNHCNMSCVGLLINIRVCSKSIFFMKSNDPYIRVSNILNCFQAQVSISFIIDNLNMVIIRAQFIHSTEKQLLSRAWCVVAIVTWETGRFNKEERPSLLCDLGLT